MTLPMSLKVGRGCPQPAASLKDAPVDSGALRTTRPTSRWFMGRVKADSIQTRRFSNDCAGCRALRF